jgi:hypothetical protein
MVVPPDKEAVIPSRNNQTIENIVILIILICLSAILFIVWFIYGPGFLPNKTENNYLFLAPVTTAY